MISRRIATWATAGVAAAAIIVGGGFWWADHQKFEKTDNAFVQADKIVVAPQIEGYVSEVLVGDNQPVEAGQVVVRLDAASIRAQLAQAEAQARALDAAVRGVDDKSALARATIAEKAAGVQSARAQASLAAAERNRYDELAQRGWASPQKLQTVRAGFDQASAAVDQATATLEAERRSGESLGSARAQSKATADAARAAVDLARIELARTELRAPVAGVVGARSVRIGQYVRPGLNLMSIVPVGDSYVIANFKETQLARLRIGQPVTIRADAFGGEEIKGRVQSFAPATGAEFAMIPVENAVGNFTKITQRVPVRIAVDRGAALADALRPGLSVEVKVDVTRQSGASFAQAAPAPKKFARREAIP